MLLGFIEGPDLIIILVIVLVLFGGAKLPQLARSLGQAKKELDAGLREGASDSSSSKDHDESKPV